MNYHGPITTVHQTYISVQLVETVLLIMLQLLNLRQKKHCVKSAQKMENHLEAEEHSKKSCKKKIIRAA